LVVFILLLVFALAPAQAPKAAAKFDGSAVWHPKDEQKAFNDMRRCGAMHAGGSPGTFEVCVGDAMRKHGASEAAIAFNAATGRNAYATRFVKFRTADVMEAMNPFMANSNDQIFFVNGSPVAVSADEQAMKLDGKNNAEFIELKKTYPEAFIFPHAEMQSLMAIDGYDGGQMFMLQFPIVNGCHACARVGHATIAYGFDRNGKFAGAKLTRIV